MQIPELAFSTSGSTSFVEESYKEREKTSVIKPLQPLLNSYQPKSCNLVQEILNPVPGNTQQTV